MNFFKFVGLTLASAFVVLLHMCVVQAQVKPETDQQKTLYAFGYMIAKEWRTFGFSEEEIKVITEAMSVSALRGKPQIKVEEWAPKIRPLLIERQKIANAAIIKKQKASSAELLAKEAKALGATVTKSGIIVKVLKPGTGKTPTASSKVTVHYEGTLGDGTVFDSSIKRGEPATFPLNGVIKCWTEGVQLMKVGGKNRFVCPAELAYGNAGAGSDIPPGAALIFEVELLKVE